MQGLPQITPGNKLVAYLQSASTSNEMSKELMSEFAYLVSTIIAIEDRSFEAFQGKHTINREELLAALIKVSDFDSNIDSELRIVCL